MVLYGVTVAISTVWCTSSWKRKEEEEQRERLAASAFDGPASAV